MDVGRARRILLKIVIGTVLLVAVYFVASIILHCIISYRPYTRAEECQNNMRLIQHAKSRCAIKSMKVSGDTVDSDEVLMFIDGGMPECPDGGEYSFNKVETDPTCSIGGDHSL